MYREKSWYCYDCHHSCWSNYFYDSFSWCCCCCLAQSDVAGLGHHSGPQRTLIARTYDVTIDHTILVEDIRYMYEDRYFDVMLNHFFNRVFNHERIFMNSSLSVTRSFLVPFLTVFRARNVLYSSMAMHG